MFAFSLRIFELRCRGNNLEPLTKRQREILNYLNEFMEQNGYAPSLEEIGRRFGLSSLATVHKHLTNLQEKGFIRRTWNRSRSVELLTTRAGTRTLELPLLGHLTEGLPIDVVIPSETISVPESLTRKPDSYVLRVRGDSMLDQQLQAGDLLIVEDRKTPSNGETVIVILGESKAYLMSFNRDRNRAWFQQKTNTDTRITRNSPNLRVQGIIVGVIRILLKPVLS